MGGGASRTAGAAVTAGASPPLPVARWITTAEAAARLGISRDTLDRYTRDAPDDLPGAPEDAGRGRNRHLRWDATELDVWFRAFCRWQRERRRTTVPRPTTATKRRSKAPRRAVAQDDNGPITFAEVRGRRGR